MAVRVTVTEVTEVPIAGTATAGWDGLPAAAWDLLAGGTSAAQLWLRPGDVSVPFAWASVEMDTFGEQRTTFVVTFV